jgi:PAS domain S-box-containing protein
VRFAGALWLLLLATAAGSEPAPLEVGVLAVRPVETTRREWQQLFDALQGPVGQPLHVRALSRSELETQAPQLDVIIANPENLAFIRRTTPFAAVATIVHAVGGQPVSQFGGVIFSREGSSFVAAQDVARGTVAAVDEAAVGGFLLPRFDLERQGIHARHFLFTGLPHDEVVRAVLDGRADVGFVRTGVLEAMAAEGHLSLGTLHVIAERHDDFPLRRSTELFPEWPVALSPRVPPLVARRLTLSLLQLTPDDPALQGAGLHGFLPPADYGAVEAIARGMHARGPNEFDLTDVGLRYGWVLAFISVALLVVMGALLSRERRARAALASRAHEDDLLLESLGEGVCGVDERGLVTFANDAALSLFGLERQTLLGKDLHQTTHHHHRDGRPYPNAECDLTLTLLDGRTRAGESTFFKADGTAFPVWLTSSALKDDAGVHGAVVTFLDLSEKNRSEDELARARDAANASSQAKSRFLATMSHELRTPLNGMLGMAQLLALPDVDEATRRACSETLLESGRTLQALLNDVLDLSKVEAGKLEVTHAALAPSVLASAVRTLFAAVATQKSLAFDVRFDGPATTRVLGDPMRLRQMLSNLVGNALKFTEAGRVEAVLSLEGQGDETWLRCVVSDTGPGIAPAQQQRLFQPFAQLEDGHSGGTGLGLSIVRQLAVLMGGDAGLESEVGQGSSFWFHVPAPRTSAAPDASLGVPSTLPCLGLRVLVADDNAVNRKVARGLLERLGCEVVTVDDGQQAVEQVARDAGFDVVLMDCQMPVLDGLEATRQLRAAERATERHLPVLALTAAAFAEDRARCLEAGMDGFLSKPISLEQLIEALTTHTRATQR